MKMNFAKKATALAMSVLFAVSMAGCGSSASTAKKVEVTSVEDLADLNIDEDVKAEIDLKDKQVGNYKVPVKLSLPDGYEMVEDVYTEVVISPAPVSDESK